MANETEREIYRAHRTAQEKYSYFLLAAAGAGIALAVNQTAGAELAWPHMLLGIGILSWGLSFVLGCRHLAYVTTTLYANAELLKVQSGRHSEVGNHPQALAAAAEGIRRAIEYNSHRSNRLAIWQFRFLITGAILYIVWHILGMYLRGEP